MAVQLKTTVIRKAINEIVSVGSDRGDASLTDVLVINTRGMVIDQDNGTITLKFKPNGQPDQKKTPKAKEASDEASGLEFARGEKKALRTEFKENIEDNENVKLNMFGKLVTIRDVEAMIVGFENNKFRVRKANGRVVNATVKGVLAYLSGEAAPEKKPVKKKPASSGTKPSTSSGAKLVKTKVTGKNPYTPTKIAQMKKKFVKEAKGLMTKGISKGLFWKPIQIEDRVYRIVACSATEEKVRLLNIKTGKTVVKAVSAVFPLSN